MNISEAIEHLSDMKMHKEHFQKFEGLREIVEKDIEAIDIAIAVLEEKVGDTNG
jgi:hypothetical protein